MQKPNGRIPVIIDHDNGGLAVFEGNAILSYLTRKYDPNHLFSFAIDGDDYTRAESWIGWQHGGLGPMSVIHQYRAQFPPTYMPYPRQGQANYFVRSAKERIPYPTQRYVGEAERLYGILMPASPIVITSLVLVGESTALPILLWLDGQTIHHTAPLA
jgi:glutathione S-transferase